MRIKNVCLALGLAGLCVAHEGGMARALGTLDFPISYTANNVTTQGGFKTNPTATPGQHQRIGRTRGTHGYNPISYISPENSGGNDNVLSPNQADPNKLTGDRVFFLDTTTNRQYNVYALSVEPSLEMEIGYTIAVIVLILSLSR